MVDPRRIARAAPLAAAFVLLAGCSGADDQQAAEDTASSPAATQETDEGSVSAEVQVTFDGSSCSYTGPSDVSQGSVGVDVVNDSETGSGALLLRLAAGATFDDVVDAHQPEPYLGEPLDFAEPAGAVGRVQPGGSGSSTFPVETGDYVLLCLVDTDDSDEAASYLAQPVGVSVTE